jgi:hypothetical protein
MTDHAAGARTLEIAPCQLVDAQGKNHFPPVFFTLASSA